MIAWSDYIEGVKDMKKKIIALLLAGTMALPLSACGGSSSASSGSKKQPKQTAWL